MNRIRAVWQHLKTEARWFLGLAETAEPCARYAGDIAGDTCHDCSWARIFHPRPQATHR